MRLGEDRPAAVKCFTCPRERRDDEAGWYFVDVPDRARGFVPARLFVCPRHYRQFAAQERGRWVEIAAPPAAPRDWLAAPAAVEGTPAPVGAVLTLGLPDPLASNS